MMNELLRSILEPPVKKRQSRVRRPRKAKEPIAKDIDEHIRLLHKEFKNILFETGFRRNEEQTYFPQEYGKKLPEEGAWIMVSSVPGTSIRVEPASMYYAMGVQRDYDQRYMVCRHLARIITEEGELMLWPHEYVIVKDISKYYEFIDEGLNTHWLSDDAAVNPDSLFYIRSRGISKKDAFLMLVGEVKEQNLCYFTFDKDIQQHFFSMKG